MELGKQHGRALEGRPTRRRRDSGSSLAEVLVATSVMSVALVGVLNVLVSAVLTNRDARSRSFATHIAEKQIETARSIPFASLASVSPDATDGDVVSLQQVLGTAATWRRVVAANSSTLKGVQVTVTWAEGGDPRSLSLSTLVCKDGVASISSQ